MTVVDERSLAGDVPTVDVTPPVTPQDFDFAAFLAGVRPTRRAVQLFPHAHLIAELEQLAARIEHAEDGAETDLLIDRFDDLKAQFRTGVWFVVEKRSQEWVKKFRDDTESQLGIKRDADGELASADLTRVILRQAAAQIITPTGVSGEQLERMAELNEGEASKLVAAVTLVNDLLAESSKVLTRDFSRRRSAKTATPES